jgi:medium-chain acyl-[acyl-carrier-protein] hydrolase
MACLAEGRGAAAMARLFERAAGPHAASLGAGIDALRSKGQAWMLVQLGIAVRRWPQAGEQVAVITWPSRRTAGARAWREFEVFSGEGELLAEAASVWLIVDLQSRRPVRLPRFLLELEFPPKDTGIQFEAVPEPPPSSPRLTWRTVVPQDLDINMHANNSSYMAWAEADAAVDAPCALQVDFRGEALLGDEIRIETWDLAGQEVIQRIQGRAGLCASLHWRRTHRGL